MSDRDLGTYQPLTYYQMMEVSLRELLVEKGVITEAEVEMAMREIKARSPESRRKFPHLGELGTE